MKIHFVNMPKGASKVNFILRFYFNIFRTWYLFNIKFYWVKYKGFVRVMAETRFAKRNIEIGDRVQFGQFCSVSTDVIFGNNILIAGRVGFVGKNDHGYDVPGQYIWDGDRGQDGVTVVEDDVWIGFSSTIIAGVTIGKGAIIAAGSLVNTNVPSCEIWGGIPAKKIKNRFESEIDEKIHKTFLDNQNKK
ncbi:MAG: acyltransferase [Leadbetterella sp.]|nr:acyltransferase [Leadbetterella sp.]